MQSCTITHTSPPRVTAATPTQSVVGSHLSVPELDWSGYRATVVLALSTACHFCTESAPFYRQLAALRHGNPNLGLIAVLLQPVEQSTKYLSDEQVSVNRVLSLPLETLKVGGTPTMLLVGRDGVVLKAWVGRLDEGTQAIALKAIVASAGGRITS